MTWFDGLPRPRRDRLQQLLDHPRSREAKQYAGGDVGFACWLVVANAACVRGVGVGLFDLADMPWREWYDSEFTPRAALQMALQQEGLAS
jgi:hypothetical protein